MVQLILKVKYLIAKTKKIGNQMKLRGGAINLKSIILYHIYHYISYFSF